MSRQPKVVDLETERSIIKARKAQGTLIFVDELPHVAHARERDADFATMRRPDDDANR